MTTENISIIRGDTNRFEISVTSDLDGSVVDLTGASVWFTLKKSRDDTDENKIFQKTVGAGVLIADPAGGVVRVTIEASDSVSLSPLRLYAYDLQVKTATNDIFTPISGTVSVVADVTRAIS